MTTMAKNKDLKSTGYELFILLLSLVSIFNLGIVVFGSYLNISTNILDVIGIINVILTAFFIFDFAYRILTTPSKSNYFFKDWGWTDLLACIPTFRIFRLFRIVKAGRLLRQFGPKNMLYEVIDNRAGSALYLSIFGIIMVAEVAAIAVLSAETANPDANITTAGDAVWWVFVTLTTVGYGDFYPTTGSGRIAGVFVMFSGVALIGVLASFLSSFFMESPTKPETPDYASADPRARVVELSDLLAQQQAVQAELMQKIAELEQVLGS